MGLLPSMHFMGWLDQHLQDTSHVYIAQYVKLDCDCIFVFKATKISVSWRFMGLS